MTFKHSTISTSDYDLYALESIIPEHLKDNEAFLSFIEAYFEWLQLNTSSPAFILNKLTETRDLDLVEDVFLDYIQKEYAISIPNISTIDRRKLYKQVNDIYRSKGSIPSYEAVFNILFQDHIELYYPRVDILKLSEGKWDSVGQRYLNHDGFLSDNKYIQDSYFYQDFSYVIKTSQTIERWRDIVKKLLHPSGFAFFGQINIISMSRINTIKSPHNQPGLRAGDPSALPIIIDLVINRSALKNVSSSRIIKRRDQLSMNKLGPSFYHLEQIKFGLTTPAGDYDDLTIEYVQSGTTTNRLPGSEIIFK